VAERKRGEVYLYDFGGEVGPRPAIVVSRNTNSATVIVVEVTNTPFTAPHVVPVSGMLCHGRLTGYVRCDHIATLDSNDKYWRASICTLDPADMSRVDDALREALQL